MSDVDHIQAGEHICYVKGNRILSGTVVGIIKKSRTSGSPYVYHVIYGRFDLLDYEYQSGRAVAYVQHDMIVHDRFPKHIESLLEL